MEIEVKNSATGKSVTVSTANPMPVSITKQEEGYALLQTQFVAVAAKAGYAIGDFITRLDQYDNLTVPPTFLASTWFNNTQGTTLAGAPPAADLTVATGAGLALDGTDATGITPPTGGVGIRGWLSGIYNRLAGVVLAAGSATVGNVGLIANSSAVSTASPLPVRVVDVTDTTPLPVSGTVSLGAGIQEIGKFTPMVNSSSVTASNPLPVTGTVSLASAASVVISSGSVALTSGAASIGSVIVSSGAIALTAGAAAIGSVSINTGGSAATSANPVPVLISQIGTSSAVTVTGTLSTNMSYSAGTIALDGTDATGVSAPTGGAGIRGWLSGIYSRLAGVVIAAGTATIGSVKATDGTNTFAFKSSGLVNPLVLAPNISNRHQRTHDGFTFAAGSLVTAAGISATVGVVALCALVTGSAGTGLVHLQPRTYYNGIAISSGASAGVIQPVQVSVYEAPSSVTLGSAGTIINRNRNSGVASSCSFYPNSSARVGGTQLNVAIISAGETYSMGRAFDPDHEIILKPSTTYCFEVLNSQAAVIVGGAMNTRLLWYEC